MAANKCKATRVEKDSLGEKAIPADAYYGINGVRFRETFAISGYNIHEEFIIAMAMVKKAAALANMKAGVMDKEIAEAIAQASDEVIDGKWHDHFVGEAIQGGAGTGINMVANEVLANRALEIIGKKPGEYEHISPVDHVNKGQSTNDALPTGIRIAMIRLLQDYIKAAQTLADTISAKANEYKDDLKLGRTHLQDAVPMTIGAELNAWATAIRRDVERGKAACKLLSVVNMGATAIGTCINADPRYRELVGEELRAASGIKDISIAEDLVDATQNLDVLVEVSGLLRAGAVTLIKIANDLRLMASGPMAGLAEAILPSMAAGSSIMAGKVNPIVPEVVNQTCFRVLGNDLTIIMAAQAGQFELNVMEPVLALAFFENISMMAAAMNTLAEKTIKGMEFRTDRCQQYAESAMSLVTSLVPLIGYNRAADVSKEAVATGKSLIDVVLESKLVPEEKARELLDPRRMV